MSATDPSQTKICSEIKRVDRRALPLCIVSFHNRTTSSAGDDQTSSKLVYDAAVNLQQLAVDETAPVRAEQPYRGGDIVGETKASGRILL